MSCLIVYKYKSTHCLPFTHLSSNKQVGNLPTLLNMSASANLLKPLIFRVVSLLTSSELFQQCQFLAGTSAFSSLFLLSLFSPRQRDPLRRIGNKCSPRSSQLLPHLHPKAPMPYKHHLQPSSRLIQLSLLQMERSSLIMLDHF